MNANRLLFLALTAVLVLLVAAMVVLSTRGPSAGSKDLLVTGIGFVVIGIVALALEPIRRRFGWLPATTNPKTGGGRHRTGNDQADPRRPKG